MPCSTRIRCAAWVRRSASCAAARAGGTGNRFFRRAGRGVMTAPAVCALEALIPGVGQQGDARYEGQQLDQAGRAHLGQIVNRPGGSVRSTAAPRHR